MNVPIVLFIYNRPEHTRQTLEALAANTLAQESDLFIYADGPKVDASEEQLKRILQAREVARSHQWCKTVSVIESNMNMGLAASVISGVTEVVNKYGRVIVLEDDIVTGKYFLEYMNTALEKYENEKRVWEIAGFRFPVKSQNTDSCFFSSIPSCWGWATWADRWKFFNKNPLQLKSTFTKKMIWEFNVEGAYPGYWNQVEMNLSGKINTWAVFWAAIIYLKKGFVLTPCKSIVKNIGFDNSGQNCEGNTWFTTTDSTGQCLVANYPTNIELDRDEFNKDKIFLENIARRERDEKDLSHIIHKALSFFYFSKKSRLIE